MIQTKLFLILLVLSGCTNFGDTTPKTKEECRIAAQAPPGAYPLSCAALPEYLTLPNEEAANE